MTKRFSLFPWRSRTEIARDVDAELAFHLEMRVNELVAGGLAADEARRRAQEEFGDIEFTRKYCRRVDERTDRETRTADRLGEWRQDVRYAWRTLWRSPGFTIVSLITLALAIGANTAIFSVTEAVLLRPLPFGNPGALVVMRENWPGHPNQDTPTTPPNYVDYRTGQRSFTDMAAFTWGHPGTWQPENADPVGITTLPVSASLFSVLQVPALMGRTFATGDDTPGSDVKAVISYAFWQRAFSGDRAAVGRHFMVNGLSYELLGVMPRGFTFGYNEDLWLPLDLSSDLANPTITRKQHWINVVARLRPGVSIDAARADLLAIAHRLAEQYPAADSGRMAVLTPLHDQATRNLKQALLLLLGGAVMVLLIACANLANLTLSRTTGRRREMAVRAALGAGRGRLVRQLLIESILLSLIGGALGVGLATVGTRLLLALNPNMLTEWFKVGIDGGVLLFSVVLSIGTGILFGVIPALDASRADLNSSLRDGGRGASGGRSGSQVRRALVVAQVGLAVVLLVGAGLLIRSFGELTRVHLGFNESHVLTAQLRASGQRYDSATAVNTLFDGVLDGIRGAPGVIAVGAATKLPTQGRVGSSLRVVGEPMDESNLPDVGYVSVRGDYFKAMGIALKAGRDYGPADAPGAPKTVLINESAAHAFFPKGDAIGRQIRIGPNPNGTPMEVIGIVADLRDEELDLPTKPMLYANHRQEAWDLTMNIVVRTTGDPMAAVPLLRHAVKAADPSLSLRNIQSMEEVVGAGLAARRFALGLIACFAVVALLLAAVGIYGVLAFMVTSRTREFGVRLALGATTGSVLRLVVRQGMEWSLLGLAFGIAAAIAGGRVLAGSLYKVAAIDAVTYVSVAGGLLVVVVAACLIPAARATRVDPIASMRAE